MQTVALRIHPAGVAVVPCTYVPVAGLNPGSLQRAREQVLARQWFGIAA